MVAGGRSEEQAPLLGGREGSQDGSYDDDDVYGDPQPCKEVPPQVCVRQAHSYPPTMLFGLTPTLTDQAHSPSQSPRPQAYPPPSRRRRADCSERKYNHSRRSQGFPKSRW